MPGEINFVFNSNYIISELEALILDPCMTGFMMCGAQLFSVNLCVVQQPRARGLIWSNWPNAGPDQQSNHNKKNIKMKS